MTKYDLIIKSGIFFDGKGSPPQSKDIFVKDGKVVDIRSSSTQITEEANKIIDAKDLWVMPGFIDCHTHYDAELEFAPSLSESLRHGVTTVTLGSCSLGVTYSEPEDFADMYSRVEGVPYDYVISMYKKIKNWSNPKEYVKHLNEMPLGPNVISFLGHSDLRMKVMGIDRAMNAKVKPNRNEIEKMESYLNDALDAGYLGLSINTNPWDKMDGNRYRSKPLPSTYARWSEYLRLTKILRKRNKIFMGVPNLTTKVNVLMFYFNSIGWIKKKLKTTIITLIDLKSSRILYRLLTFSATLFNKILRADFKWQVVPVPFELFIDGLDAPVFEEFGAGTAALHLKNISERSNLLKDKKV